METCFKILQLKFDKKLTNRCIGLTLHISASTVFEVLARFKASSLSWPLPADISHDTLEKLIFPPKDTSASELVMPDMLYFDTEMRKSGVTRQLLWMEYWICPYISRHLLSLNPLQARCRRYSRGER